VLHRIIDALDHERRARRRALLEMLTSDRYRTLLEHFEAAASSPIVTNADARLEKIAGREFDKLRRTVRRVGKTPDDAELHRIRIKSKRARYAAELAEAMRGKPATRFIDQVKILQDLLGEHHDAVVAEQLLRTALPPNGDRKMALLVGLLIERQRERRRAMRAAFAKTWAKTKRCGRSVWR
jgi:CHAD domain-containing protein